MYHSFFSIIRYCLKKNKKISVLFLCFYFIKRHAFSFSQSISSREHTFPSENTQFSWETLPLWDTHISVNFSSRGSIISDEILSIEKSSALKSLISGWGTSTSSSETFDISGIVISKPCGSEEKSEKSCVLRESSPDFFDENDEETGESIFSSHDSFQVGIFKWGFSCLKEDFGGEISCISWSAGKFFEFITGVDSVFFSCVGDAICTFGGDIGVSGIFWRGICVYWKNKTKQNAVPPTRIAKVFIKKENEFFDDSWEEIFKFFFSHCKKWGWGSVWCMTFENVS